MSAHTPRAVADVVRSSTHPAEVAATLESIGINDRVARTRFGTTDVFALAGSAVDRHGHLAPTDPEADPRPAPPRTPGPSGNPWFHLRGLLYAIPAVVALVLLPAGDHVESGLLIGGLALSWALGYGVTAIAWSYIGALDVPAAHRFLRRALAGGTAAAVVLSVVAVFASLLWTTTMQVTLGTVVVLVGQTTYLLSAATLLMTGGERWLLLALVPAVVGAALGAPDGRIAAPLVGPTEGGHGAELGWLAATVLLALGLAVWSTRGARRPVQPLPRATWVSGVLQVGYGLLVAILVLYPAIFELTVQNYSALPLSFTLAALPLVLSMGIGEALLQEYRASASRLLAAARTRAEFARRMRRTALRVHLQFAAALAAMTAGLGGIAAAAFGLDDIRYVVLGVDYVVLGTAVFSGMVLTLLGRVDTVLVTCGIAVAALVGFDLLADHTVTDLTAILWHAGVALALLVAHTVLVARHAGQPVAHR